MVQEDRCRKLRFGMMEPHTLSKIAIFDIVFCIMQPNYFG